MLAVVEGRDYRGWRASSEYQEALPGENYPRRHLQKSMIHNGATPKIEVDSETYEVRADGELLTCAPAEVLPMAQRYFMF